MNRKSVVREVCAFAAIFCFASVFAGALPHKYKALDYIESTGTQSINTGIDASATLQAEMDFTPLEYTGNGNLGTYADTDQNDWRFANYRLPSYNAYGVFFDCGNAGVGHAWTTPYLTNGLRYLAKVGTDDDGKIYMNVTDVEQDATVADLSATANGTVNKAPVYVFGCYVKSGSNHVMTYTKMRLYSLKLFDYAGEGAAERTLLRDFVPCKDRETGVVGLYDRVSCEFFPNEGAGEFVFAESGPTIEAETYAANIPTEPALLAPGRKLKDLMNIQATFRSYCLYAMDSEKVYGGFVAADSGANGIYHYTNDGQSAVAQFEYAHSTQSGKYKFGLVLALEQRDDGVYGYVRGVDVGIALGDDISAATLTTSGKKYFMTETEQDDWKTAHQYEYSITAKNLVLSFYDAEQEFAVTFVDKDENALKTVKVKSGEAVAASDMPTPPEVAGYVFDMWDMDLSCIRDNLVTGPVYRESAANYLTVGEAQDVNGDLVVELGVRDLPVAARLVALYGMSDVGTAVAEWGHVLELDSCTPGEGIDRTYTLAGLCNQAVVRFALVGEGAEDAEPFTVVSDPLLFAQKAPLGVVAVGEIGKDNVTRVPFALNLETFGNDCSAADLSVEIATGSPSADYKSIKIGTVADLGESAFELGDLTVATTYYVRVVIDNGNARYVSAVQTFTTYNPFVAHPGDTLTWNGGAAGTWDATSENWLLNFDGTSYPVAWVDGCAAVFPASAELAVAGAKSVMGFTFGSDVVLTGDPIEIVEPAAVLYAGNANVRIANDVTGAAGLKTTVEDAIHDTVCFGADDWIDQDANANEPTLWFRNVNLADVNNIRGTIYGKVSGSTIITKTVDRSTAYTSYGGNAGVCFYQNNGQTLTAQFQGTPFAANGSGCFHCVKIELTQVGADVYGRVVYVRSFWHAGALGDDFDEIDEYGPETHLRELQLIVRPSVCNLTCNGGFAVTGLLDLEDGNLTFGENATFGEDGFAAEVKLSAGDIVFGNTTEQSVKGKFNSPGVGRVVVLPEAKCTFEGGKGENYNLCIKGTVVANEHGTLPREQKSTVVCPGGELVMGDFGSYLGPNGYTAPIRVQTNGILRLTTSNGIGTMKPVSLDGGEVVNVATNKSNVLYNWTVQDGARFSGEAFTVGHFGAWSSISVKGAAPSAYEAKELIVGFQYSATDTRIAGVVFNVEDVTGDAASDFTISGDIVDKPNFKLYEEGYRLKCGIRKTGAGTLEIAGSANNEPQGTFQLEAGTVRIGATAGGTFGALVVQGDAAIDCAGGTMEFADSSEMPWADGATLNLTGEIGKKSIRFGTDANGLTAAQLAAIAVNGKKGRVAINEEGYLSVSRGFALILK